MISSIDTSIYLPQRLMELFDTIISKFPVKIVKLYWILPFSVYELMGFRPLNAFCKEYIPHKNHHVNKDRSSFDNTKKII